MVNIIPGDDVVVARGGRLSDGENESPVEPYYQQLQDLLSLHTVWQVGSASCAGIPHPRVWMLRLGYSRLFLV